MSNKSSYTGLTSAEVTERLQRGESNAFEARVARTYGQILRDNVLNLFNIVLGTLLIIVLIYGDYTTVMFAGFSVFFNSLLGTIQEISAKRKLDKLAALSVQTVKVWRDSQQTSVPMNGIVKDDVIVLEPGDRLVVDGRILQEDSLEIDESLLTGESDAVLKDAGDEVFSGSFCVAGAGLMQATRVGRDSTVNKLSTIAKTYKNVQTPTQEKIAAMVTLSVVVMFIMGPMIFVSGLVNKSLFLNILRNAVVFTTSLVPQGLVLVAILSLTIGAVKISRRQTLVQRVNAVESLANVTVLCFDKTGTLTENRLAVSQVLPLNGISLEEIQSRMHVYVNNLAHLNRTAGAVAAYTTGVGQSASAIEKIMEIPFSSSRKWGAVVLPDETLIMGAPERVLDGRNADLVERAEQLSDEGMRVLAFARSKLPPSNGQLDVEREPLALIVMSDQPRANIRETLQAFRDQNVELKVISGDSLRTVKAIAQQAGMVIREAYNGQELDAMSDGDFEATVARANLFARIEPDTKRRIIAALRKRGEYVAMVGDGVNDVPALKEAQLAIVMNDGTQISKDVADIVLLNNAMSTLPLAFKEGRKITQIVYGTTKMFIVRCVYNVLLFVFAGFMFLPFPITPAQISWVAFGTVNLPSTLIAFGWWRPKPMQKFRRDVLDYTVVGGITAAAMLAILYAIVYISTEGNLVEARSAVTLFISLFGMLVVWNMTGVEVFEPRTFLKHRLTVSLSGMFTILTILGIYSAPHLFEFVAPEPSVVILIAALFDLGLILISIGMRNRYLLNRMWMLFDSK